MCDWNRAYCERWARCATGIESYCERCGGCATGIELTARGVQSV